MRITFTKGEREDRIAIVRVDGSAARFIFPRKGPTPHDAYHYVVERELGLCRGFWGLVEAGMDPGQVGAMAVAGGHASAARAAVPDAGVVELIQAERLVECFEAESWSTGVDNAAIRAMAFSGWEASFVPPLTLTDREIDSIRAGIARIGEEWDRLSNGRALEFEWERANG